MTIHSQHEPEQPKSTAASLGPVIIAIIGAILPAGMLIAMLVGLPVNMMTVLSVMVPGMSTATVCIAMSMAWAFQLAGEHRRVRWLPLTIAAIVLAMVLLLALTMILLCYNPPSDV